MPAQTSIIELPDRLPERYGHSGGSVSEATVTVLVARLASSIPPVVALSDIDVRLERQSDVS